MRIGCVYNKDDRGLSGLHWTNNAYRFFRCGLLETNLASVDILPVDENVRAEQFEGYDALIFYSLENLEPEGLSKLPCLKVARAPDAHSITEEWIDKARREGFELVINHQSPEYIRRYLPDDFRYEQIIFGINEEIHQSPKWSNRISDRILLTGVIRSDEHYRLRKMCKKQSRIKYVGKGAGFVGDGYAELLGMYRTAIAACSTTSVYKYFEIPACGCLSFMEVNSENGCDNLGFVDGENAVFIDEGNYKKRLKEYIKSLNDPKWRRIADNGRRFVLEKYENRVQVKKLIDIINDILVAEVKNGN